MAGDENRIEIIIDAAETKSAAKSATEANQRLSEFRKALDAFKNGVGDLNKTIETNTTTVANFNTFLQDFSTKLNDNLSKMQESVIKDFEPRLEKNLENMVARAINKVEAKTSAPGKESRSRSEPKAGPGATPTGQTVSVGQPPGYEKPDVRAKATFTAQTNQIVDGITGAITEVKSERSRASTTRTENWQEPVDGEMVNFTRTITEVSNSVKKFGDANKKSNNWADPSNMMRREITGALIALHVMKVVAGNSQVAASGFNMISNAVGHLLNVTLLPMIPIFSVFAQLIHQVANVINSMPYGIRLLIGGLVMWKATSTLIASMPIREFGSGIEQLKENLKGGSDTLNKFGEVVKALINFMNSGLRGGRVQGLAEWVGGKIRGKRAGGGPVGASNAYIVGEKGPELFVPDSSGTIVPNSAFRADGGGVEPGGGLPFGDILGNLGAGLGAGGLTYLLTGSPLLAGGVGAGAAMLGPAGIAQAMSGIISSEIGQQVIGSLNVLTGIISSLFAPLAPIFGILSVALGVVTGMKAGGGGGDNVSAATTAKVGTALNSTIARGNFGIQSTMNSGSMGTNKLISMILVRLAGCLRVAPCDGANFGGAETTVIAGLLPTILASIIAIPTGINTKLGEFVTEATVKIKSIWEPIPQPEALADRTAKIRYQIETVGEKPVVVDTAAKIRYNIETVGSAPVAQDVTAKIKYNIETTGTAPVATDISARARYTIETVGTAPSVNDINAKIVYTNTMPTTPTVVDATGRIIAIDVTGITPSAKSLVMVGTVSTVKVADPLKANPPLIDTTGRITDAKPSDAIKSKVPTIDVTGKIASAKPSDLVLSKPPEIPVSGKLKPIDVTNIKPIEIPIDPKVPAGTDPLKGIKWGDMGKSAGGLVGIGLFAALDEFARTGKVNWLPLTASLTTAFVLWTGAEMALTGIATSLGGAAAGAAVGTAMATVGAALIAAMLVPMAARFAGDFYRGIENAVNQGSFTPGVFDNFALKAAAEAGASFGKWLNDWLDKNLNIDLSGAIEKMAQGENGWLIDILQGGAASAISLILGPSAGLAFNTFINDMQKTLSGGVPVDVKMDVESMTQTIKSIASTVNGDGTYTYNPTGSTQPLGTNPVDPTGKPIQGPLKPDGSFALGGPVAAGGLYLVGEKGPELFAPDVGGQIIPNNKIGGGGGSNVTNNFTFNVTANNPKELTDTVMRELKMELARVKM